MSTFATMFTGFGGADIGLAAAGLTPTWGIEYREDIAAVYRRNLSGEIIVADVRAVDYARLPRPDWLHASPVCTRASVANPTARESAEDGEIAGAVVRALRALRPRWFSLENVWGYRSFAAFRAILNTLGDLDYIYDYEHVNAANFGVPQTRRRLILRAVHGVLPPALPAPVRWVSWYEAIQDLFPTLPESTLAPWQLARLPDELRDALLFSNDAHTASGADSFVPAASPAQTVTTQRLGRSRAVLVKGDDHSGADGLVIAATDAPAFGVRAGRSAVHRAILDGCRVVAMTPRCLARFQSFPDSYELPEKRTLAAAGIGNAVPPLLIQRIAEQMIAE